MKRMNGMNETMEMKSRYKKQLQDLNLSDNFLFAFAMSDEGVCKEFLEKLLGIDIEELEIVQSELTHEVAYDAKAVRFDIYVRDKAGIYTPSKISVAKIQKYHCKMTHKKLYLTQEEVQTM